MKKKVPLCKLAYVLIFIDNEAPQIICIEDQSIQADEGSTAMVIWKSPLASDNSGNVSVTCNPQSGANFTIGLAIVICEAIDGSENSASCSFQVNVTGNYCVCKYLFFIGFSLIYIL